MHLASAYQVMDCNEWTASYICGGKANFRAMIDGEPFQWWCHDCYQFCFHEHERVAHDISDPVICCECHVLPATCRVHTTLFLQDCSKTTYWCYACYERHENHEHHHVCDLDSASDPTEKDVEEDVGAAEEVEEEVESRYEEEVESQFQEDAEHHCEDVAVKWWSSWQIQDGAMSESSCQIQDGAMSESSWQIQDGAMSESSWHIQDDCSSTKSFNLTWHQVDDDASDASSQCSFMMVTPGSLTAENVHKHQQCDAAADAAATEDAVSTSNNLGAGQEQHAPAEQEHLQRAWYGPSPPCTSNNLGAGQEQHAPAEQEHQQRGQMHTILALHDPTSSSKQSTAAAAQESQPTSSSSSSQAAAASSFGKWQEQQELDIALAATAAAVLAAAQQNRNKKKVPRWPLSDFHPKPLQPIQEQPILATPYRTPSGCLEIMFNQDDDAVAHHPCIKHGLGHHPHCRDCVNYQFMLEKSQYAMAEQTALQLSLDNSKIVGPVGTYMQCSKHGENFQEDCPTCLRICGLRDQWAS